MTRLLPYLHLQGDHVCAELFNNCRTLAYMTNAQNAGSVPGVWRNAIFANDCNDCCCHTVDEGDYTFPGDTANNPAPWFDASNPASEEAFGLLVDRHSFNVESARSARIRSNRGARPLASVDFSIVSSTQRGANYLHRWLLDVVDNCCRSCTGLEATVFETCAPLSDVCAPGDVIQAGQQAINDEGEVVVSPFTICYTPFEFGMTDQATLFSNVCPGQLQWIEGGSFFSAGTEPTLAQLSGPWVDFPGEQGCGVEIRGRDGSEIPGERDIFRLPIDGVPGPVDGNLTVQFSLAQTNGDIGVGVYNFVTDTWIPITSMIAPAGAQNLGTHVRMSGSTSTGPLVLTTMADGQEITELQVVAFSMGQGFNSTTATNAELLTDFRFSWRGTQTVASVEHGTCGGGWLVNGVNVDDATTVETWTDAQDLTDWMNAHDPNGVVWVYDATENTICSSVDLIPSVANQYGSVSGCGGQLMQPEGEGERFDPDPDLIPLTDPSPFLDLGRRQMVSFRFLSIEELDDTDFFGACSGERFRLNFEVVDTEIYGDPVPVCSINTWRTEWAEPALARVAGNATLDCTNCGVPCRCQGTTTETGEVAEETCFVERPEVIRAACLTPAIPQGVWLPVIRLRNPSATWVENAKIRIVPALNNAPSILNRTQGALWYQNQVSAMEGNIVGIAPGSTMILDGRNSRAEILCFNGETISGAGTIFGPLGRTFRMPALGCGTYWLEVALSTADLTDGDGQEYGGLDLEIDFQLVPVFGLV